MDRMVEEQIRGLAQPLWESAARPYGMAMDFWLMAEQMVLEMMAVSARMHNKVVSPAPPLRVNEPPDAVPVDRVKELAECMWDSAGRQYGVAQDFWLAAERHVLAMLRASLRNSDPSAVSELAMLSPAAYLERIRVMAYSYWENAGRSYGHALDCWLRAERDMLGLLSAGAPATAAADTRPPSPADPPPPAAQAPAAPETAEAPAQQAAETPARKAAARPRRSPKTESRPV